MKQKLLVVAFLLAIPLIALTAEWVSVYISPEEEGFINTQSIKPEKNGLVYYQKRTLLKGTECGYKKIYGAKAHETLTDIVENCAGNSSKILRITLTDAEGKPIMQATTPSEIDFVPVLADSNEAKSHQYICTSNTPPKTTP